MLVDWIDIKDKYPPRGEPVLLWDGHDVIQGFWDETAGNFYQDEEYIGGYDWEHIPVPVTHWAPLPEGPHAGT